MRKSRDAIEEDSSGDENQGKCMLCLRIMPLTAHHLIPRSQHKKTRSKKNFSRDDMKSRIAMLCEACHKNLHKTLSEKDLAYEYNTIEKLNSHPAVEKFTLWIKKKPDGFLP